MAMRPMIMNVLPFKFVVTILPASVVSLEVSFRISAENHALFQKIAWPMFGIEGTFNLRTIKGRHYLAIHKYIHADAAGYLDVYEYGEELRNEVLRVCAAYKPALTIVETYDIILGRLLTDQECMNPE